MIDLIDQVKRTLRSVERESLVDPRTWQMLLPLLGLNDENPHELPPEVLASPGLGLRIYQYPNQFAPYMSWIASRAGCIKSYLEIGTRHGGTFAVHVELLKLLNAAFSKATAVDIIPQPQLLTHYEYRQDDSLGDDFAQWMSEQYFDLVFIDGDHSYRAVKSDASLTIDKSQIQVFHDICSDACPGVSEYWQEHKVQHRKTHNFIEFTDQYDSVDGTYFGIGVSFRQDSCVSRCA